MIDQADAMAAIELRPAPDSPSKVRNFTREHMVAWGCSDMVPEAQLCLDELVTNAILHARSSCRVEILRKKGEIVAKVHDSCSGAPVERPHSLDSLGGRGLHLVQALAARWGWEPEPGGKVVWCVFSRAI